MMTIKTRLHKYAVIGAALALMTGSANARLFIDYEGGSAAKAPKDDPLVPIVKQQETKAVAATDKPKQVEPAKVVPAPAAAKNPVSVVATKPDVTAKPVAAKPATASSEGVVNEGAPYGINQTSSGRSLKIGEAMQMITPNSWTSSIKGSVSEAPKVSWDAKNESLESILAVFHAKTGLRFLIDWNKKNIEVHGI